MSNRFHNKWHRHNHHTVPTTGEPDSSHDPIASPSDPFQGSFVVNGPVSSNNIVYAGEGDSSKWNNTYSTVNANSSMWMGVTSVNNMGDGVNIVAGPNINITNNASSKTITVSASAPSPISTYVRTFNNMDGNVKIAEGPNIKLITNPSTKTVTISSKSDGGVLSLNELDGNIELIAGTNINIQKNDSNKSLSISAIESDEWSYNKKLNFNPHVGKLNKNIYPVYSNISNTSYSSQIRYAVDKGLTEYIFYVSMPSDTIHDTSVYCGFMNERDSNKYYLDGNPLIVPHMAHQSYPIDIVFVSQDALILKSKVKDSNVIKYYLYELDGTFNSHQFIEANAIDITSIIGAGQEYILQYDKNNGSPRLIRFELADSVIDDIRYKDTSIAVFDAKTLVMKGNPITFFRSVSAGALFHMTTALDGPYADNVSTYQSPIESQRYPITFNKDYTRSDNASFFQYYFIPESFNIIGVTPFRIGTTGGVNYFINADAVMHFKVPSTFLDMGLNSIDEITPISDTSMEISDQGPFLTVGDADTRRLVEIPGSWARSEYGNISNLSSFNYTGKNAVKIYDYDPVSKNLYLSIRTDGNKMVKLIYNNIDWNTFVFTATAKYDKLIEINPPILIPYGLGFMHQTSLLSSNFGIFDCRGKAINGGIYTDEYQFITAEISPQRQLISSLTSYNISAWNLNLIPNSVKPLQMCVDNNIIPLSSWFMVPTTFRQNIAWPFISTTIDANGKTHRYIARNAPNDSSTKVYEISAVNHSELGMVISGVEIMDMPTPRHPSWVNYYSSEQPELIKQLSGSYVTNYAISGNNIIYVIGTSRAPNVKYPVTMNDNRDINDMFPNRTYVDNVSSTITGVPSEVLLNNNDYVYWLSGINTPVPSYAPALSTIVMEQNYWKLNDSPVPGNVEVLSEDSVRREFSISATQYKWDGMQRLLIYDASKPEFYLVNSPVASASFVELQKMYYNNDDIMGAEERQACGGTLLLDLTQNHLYCTMVHSTNSPSPMVWDLTNQKDLTNYNKNYADPTHFGVLNDPEFNIGKYMTGLFGNQNISNKIPITNIVMVSEKDANGVNLPDTLFNLIANGNATTNNLSNKNVNILSPTNHSSFDIYVLKYPLFLDGKFWDEEELFKTSRDYYTLTLQPNTTSNIYLGTTNTINGYDVTVWADSEDYLDSFNRIKIATIFTNENGIDDNRTILYNINGYNIGESLPLQSTSTPITTFNGVATASNTFVKVTVGGKEYGILLWNLP